MSSSSADLFEDPDGPIVRRGNDGGDTARLEGRYWFGVGFTGYLFT